MGEVIKEIRTPAQDSVTGPDPVFTTLFSYDTWNRIQNLTYSDGEVLSFKYDSGGNIKTITGQKQAVAYKYLDFIGYDKFEARERVALGNGTATNYTYNPLNRRITGLLAADQVGAHLHEHVLRLRRRGQHQDARQRRGRAHQHNQGRHHGL